MTQTLVPQSTTPFVDRRNSTDGERVVGPERRQFYDNRDHLSPEARELSDAIDSYKLLHRRRFITFEEMVDVIRSLGYHK